MYKWYKERFSSMWAPGIKIWSNGIPLKLDTHSSCNNWCKYCYANELRESTLGRTGTKQNIQLARIIDIKKLVRFFENAYKYKDDKTPFMNWAIRNKYFIELGTMGETFQEADLDFRVSYNFFKLASIFSMPIFINTKLNLICKNDEYKRLLISHNAPIIICLTLTTTDDKDGKLYEPLAPLPSERLKTIKELSKYPHISTIVYISPFMPGVTDKDTEKYVNDLLDAGIVGAHLRDFFMQGKTFQNPFWLKYIENNKNSLEGFFGGYHATYESKKDFYFKAQEIANKRDKNFQIVGMKSKWFELNPYHGKMSYDNLSQSFKNGIVDFTAIPIMRKIRENINIPQLLFWRHLGYDKNKINLPEKINSNEGDINNLMSGVCNCNTSDFHYEMDGYDWLVGGLWNGWKTDIPTGFMSELDYIYPVKKGNEYYKDEENNFVYAFVPERYNNLLKNTNNQTFLFTPSTSNMDSPFIDFDFAIKYPFLICKREGGVGDKFINLENKK